MTAVSPWSLVNLNTGLFHFLKSGSFVKDSLHDLI